MGNPPEVQVLNISAKVEDGCPILQSILVGGGNLWREGWRCSLWEDTVKWGLWGS